VLQWRLRLRPAKVDVGDIGSERRDASIATRGFPQPVTTWPAIATKARWTSCHVGIDCVVTMRNRQSRGMRFTAQMFSKTYAEKTSAAGRKKFLKLVDEHLSNRPGFRISLVLLEGGHDPDSFIREHGLNAFLDLKKTSLFYWRLKQAIDGHEEKSVVADQGIGLIVNETDPLQQHSMLQQLADVTGIPYDVLNRKVQEIVSFADYQSELEIAAMAERMQIALKRNPRNAIQIIEGAKIEIERFKAPSKGVTTASILNVLDHVYEKYEARKEDVGLKTGFPLFDKLFGGMPAEPAFITCPGKANHGKTSWMTSLAVRTVDYNNDAIVLYHTIDDHIGLFLSRVNAIKYRFPSMWFKHAGKYCQENEQFRQAFYESKQWLREIVEGERFLPLDVTMLPRTLTSLEAKVKELRRAYPSRPIVVYGDNFHLYQTLGNGMSSDESGVRALSMGFKTLANTYEVCIMATMELPKASLKAGERPRIINIKGSAGVSYDSSANIGVYNDLKDFRELAQLVWNDGGVMKPVMEIVFDKSKLDTGFDGNIYDKFYPESGYYEEIAEEEQGQWAAKAVAKKGGGVEKVYASTPSVPAAQPTFATPRPSVESTEDSGALFN
jgi:hypothetical protein